MIVKELAIRGFEPRELSQLFHVNKSTIVAILAGERWSNVSPARHTMPKLIADAQRLHTCDGPLTRVPACPKCGKRCMRAALRSFSLRRCTVDELGVGCGHVWRVDHAER